MTKNQLLYQQNLETHRSNLARERETERTNRANENLTSDRNRETRRANIANENITSRRDAETGRANRAKEAIAYDEMEVTKRGQNYKLIGDVTTAVSKVLPRPW